MLEAELLRGQSRTFGMLLHLRTMNPCKWIVGGALFISGCAVGQSLPIDTVVVEDRTLEYTIAQISESFYRITVYTSGIVLLPDIDYESVLQLRGAEIAMRSICGPDKNAEIREIVPPERRRVSTIVTFRCTAGPEPLSEDKGI